MAAKGKVKNLNFDQNPIEAIRDIGYGVVDSFKKDLGQEAAATAWRQLLKPTEAAKEGQKSTQNAVDMREGEEIDLFKKEEWARVEPGISYNDTYKSEILHFGERAKSRETGEIRAKMEEIQLELVQLSKSSQELKVAFKDVSVQTLPANPGKYHLNFFEWVLATIRSARVRIEESASWLGVASGKKSKKDYWSLSKKHGTSYMLSGERAVAQQVG